MARRRSFKIPGVSFSAKRALGITKAKRNFSRFTGIPTSKAGIQRKVGKAAMGGGCLLSALSIAAILVIGIMIVITIV
ncbi:hypothetical protein [Acetanaerobacterium elongatum]|uniref:Uncharacterized protein n=1 Tax=Acetanaerobacterium elongatum TaxID=258515 RepID=A0A1H0C5U7_9FIRM|nr:hypothetical protein [Acetanaerobacterium elongatum]SDN53264.1 hypothetical protein SAMN05192585_1222 [Acetanaerobacterium elongatum]